MPNQPSVKEIARYLREMHYPADRGNIVDHARRNGASDEVLTALNGLKDNMHYSSIDDVLVQAREGRLHV